jgi:hypothetical protein
LQTARGEGERDQKGIDGQSFDNIDDSLDMVSASSHVIH